MKNILLLLFCVSFLVSFTKPFSIDPRNAAYCAYLSEKIFCYGGSPYDLHYDNKVYSLDVNNQPSTLLSDISNKWENIPAKDNTDLTTEFRYDSQFVPMPDGINMFFDGGSNDKKNPIRDKTVTYNTKDNTWRALTSFNDTKNGGFRQISKAGTVYIPSLNSIAVFGGHEYHIGSRTRYVTDNGALISDRPSYTYPSSSAPEVTLSGSYLGYYYMTLFNVNTQTWRYIPTEPLHTNGFPFLVSRQTATFHPRTGKIYFIGGLYMDYGSQDISVPLSYAITFDTINNSWGNQTLNAPNSGPMPTARHQHTATMLHTKEDILVYGGTFYPEDFKPFPVADYVYSLNLESHTWTPYDIRLPNGMSGPRYYHSAVLVNETNLFILFGINKDRAATSDVMVLDTRNVSSIAFSDTYPVLNANADTVDTFINTSANTVYEKLSGGAVAGIVIGTIAAILLVIVGIIFIRRKNDKEKMNQMEVDWDHIEGYYNQEPRVLETNFRLSKTFETVNSGSSTQIPFSPVESSAVRPFSTIESPAPRYSAYTTIVAPEQDIIKPDGSDNLIKISNPGNNNEIVEKYIS